MKMKLPLIFLSVLAASSAHAWIWQNLNKDSSGALAGENVHERDLIGKVVLVYSYSAKGCDPERLARAQDLLLSHDRTKFAVVGACRDETCDAAFLRQHKITFPVYEGGRVPHFHDKPANTMYLLDEYGRMIWQSHDAVSQRDLEKALEGAIARIGQPPSLTEGVAFDHYRTLKDQIVYGKDLTAIEAQLKKAKSAEARQILAAMGRGMERMMGDIRTLMDINGKRAYQFLDLHLKSFPRDREKYAKLYSELEKQAAR